MNMDIEAERTGGAAPRRGSRRWGPARAGWFLVVLLGAAGCGEPATIESVCEKAEELACPTWSGLSRCIADGEAIRDRVEAAGGCDGAFEEYMKCQQDKNKCDWEHVCTSERGDLIVCIGEL